MTEFGRIVQLLVDGRVDFILIGGLAGVVWGSVRNTQDVDVVYSRTSGNIQRLVEVLAPHHPYPRGAPPGLPFRFDQRQIQNGLNFTFDSDLGMLDLLGEVAGAGDYESLLPQSIIVRAFERDVRCVNLQTLIHLKRSAGRAKDLEAIAELESLRLRARDIE